MGIITDKIVNLINQYQDSPLLVGTLEAILARYADTEDMLLALQDERTLDTARGVWLDAIGVILGFSRPQEVQDGAETFTFAAAGWALEDIPIIDSDLGFADSVTPTTGGKLNGLSGLLTGVLMDDTGYRALLKYRAASKFSRCTMTDIARAITSYGATTILQLDNGVGLVSALTDESLIGQTRKTVVDFAPVCAGVEFVLLN